MIAIRGATTVGSDRPEEVREAVGELLSAMKERNALSYDDIVCLMFSNTQDIKSFYPAKAAREAGFAGCPLFSSLEPPIEGSLPLCVRVMILAETDRKPVPVYLRGAVNLRRDLTKRLVIALDGPAGSGKTTAAKNIAKAFNILYLDTGAMYRAVALECIKRGADAGNEGAVKEVVQDIDLKIEYVNGRQATVLDGEDVSDEIRSPSVSAAASKVSEYGCVRRKMVEMQRRIASSMSCVMDGRDIGTNVLPNAEHKFFVTAAPEVRAKRRYDEDRAKGYNVDLKKITEEIKERDKRDSERAIAPLRLADDAVLVDTTNLSPEQVVEFIRNKIQEKI